jgi:hypothetical protein
MVTVDRSELTAALGLAIVRERLAQPRWIPPPVSVPKAIKSGAEIATTKAMIEAEIGRHKSFKEEFRKAITEAEHQVEKAYDEYERNPTKPNLESHRIASADLRTLQFQEAQHERSLREWEAEERALESKDVPAYRWQPGSTLQLEPHEVREFIFGPQPKRTPPPTSLFQWLKKTFTGEQGKAAPARTVAPTAAMPTTMTRTAALPSATLAPAIAIPAAVQAAAPVARRPGVPTSDWSQRAVPISAAAQRQATAYHPPKMPRLPIGPGGGGGTAYRGPTG